MSNSFVARNGFNSLSSSIISGSLVVTGDVISDITSASYVASSSFSNTAATASHVLSALSASYSEFSVSSSYSLTASAIVGTSHAPTVGLAAIYPNVIVTIVTSSVSASIGLDRVLLTPFTVDRKCTVGSIGTMFGSNTAGQEATARLGLYNDNGNIMPSTLIRDFGFLSSSVISLGYQSLTPISPTIVLEKDTVYWTALVGNARTTLPIPGNIGTSTTNAMYNPLLGVIPMAVTGNIANARDFNIVGIISASAGSNLALLATMSNNINTYTLCTGSNTNLFVGPMLTVNY
jgi:hypothetical protein